MPRPHHRIPIFRCLSLVFAALAVPHVARSQQQVPTPVPEPTPAAPAVRDTSPTPAADTTDRREGLRQAAARLHEVTVVATPPHREEPLVALKVDAATFARIPAASPMDVLRQSAGLETHDEGQGPGYPGSVAMRGFSSDHSSDIALWIDGVPINEPVNGHVEGFNDWSLIFPRALRQLDVVKGPTSAHYGNFAMAGAVNVRTIDRLPGSEATLTAGAFGRLDGTLLTGFDDGPNGGVFGVRGAHETGWRPHSDYTLGQGHGRWVRSLASDATVDAGVELYGIRWDSPGYLTADQFARGAYDRVAGPTDGGFKRRAQERVSLRLLTGSALWRSTAYATQSRWQFFITRPPEGSNGTAAAFQSSQDDARYGMGATSALSWELPAGGEVTLGTETRFDHSAFASWYTTARQPDSVATDAAAEQLSGAFFLESAVELLPRLRLSAGARADALRTRSSHPRAGAPASAAKAIVSPKLGALLRLAPGLGAYANVSRGFRQTDGVFADPALPFITSLAYELGLKVDSDPASASLSLFRTDVDHEQSFDPIRNLPAAAGASRRQGIDLDGVVRATAALALTVHATVVDARYRHTVAETGDTLSGTRIFNTAPYVGSVDLALDPPRTRWHLRVGANAVGPYTPFGEPHVTLPPYALLHLSGGVRAGATSIELGVRNILDRPYPELRSGGSVIPGPPRTVHASVTQRF